MTHPPFNKGCPSQTGSHLDPPFGLSLLLEDLACIRQLRSRRYGSMRFRDATMCVRAQLGHAIPESKPRCPNECSRSSGSASTCHKVKTLLVSLVISRACEILGICAVSVSRGARFCQENVSVSRGAVCAKRSFNSPRLRSVS